MSGIRRRGRGQWRRRSEVGSAELQAPLVQSLPRSRNGCRGGPGASASLGSRTIASGLKLLVRPEVHVFGREIAVEHRVLLVGGGSAHILANQAQNFVEL